MSGKFVSVPVQRVVTGGGYNNWRDMVREPYKVARLPSANTYISIFSVDQPQQFKAFKEQFTGTILFESKPAVNGKAFHGTAPRNTIVVYEYPDENEVSKV